MKKVLSLLVVLIFVFSFSMITVNASYDPATKADKTVYRNFFGAGRDESHPEELYPKPEYLNEGARGVNAVPWTTEANYNGGIFLFKNANVTNDAKEVVLFTAADQRHAFVKDTIYNIYAAAPGTPKAQAMDSKNLIASVEYYKSEHTVTDSWSDWYSEENAGPISATCTLKKGTYDIYVEVVIEEATGDYTEDTQTLSPKLSDILLLGDSAGTPDPTEKPTDPPETKPDNTQTSDASLLFYALASGAAIFGGLKLRKNK